MAEKQPHEYHPLVNEFVALVEAAMPWSSHVAHAVLDEIGGLPPGMPGEGSPEMSAYLDLLVPAMRARLDQICADGANPAFFIRALVHHLDALLDRRRVYAGVAARNRWAVELLQQWGEDSDAIAILLGTSALNAPAERLIASRMFVDPISDRWVTADNYFKARQLLTDRQIDAMDRTRRGGIGALR